MKSLLLIGTVLGFVFCVIATYKWPNLSYYLLPTRAWEMMLGGIAYLYPFALQENRKKLFEWTGLGLIIGSYLLISSENPWPGYLAIFPVIGTFLIIQANRNNSIITNNIVFQKLGTWSYSIYLWHWPLAVAIYTFSLSEYYTYTGILLSIFLGSLSYKYIERIKFKNNLDNLYSLIKNKPIYISIFTIILSGYIFINEGVYSRFSYEKQFMLKKIESQKLRPDYDKKCFDYVAVPACTYLDGKSLTTNPPSHILLGDSHAQSLVNGIVTALSQKENFTGLKFYGMAGCLFSENISNIYPDQTECDALAKKTIEEIITKYPNIPIIYVNRLSGTILGDNNKPAKRNADENQVKLKHDLYETLRKLSQGRSIYFVTPTPEFEKNLLPEVSRNYLNGSEERVKFQIIAYYERNRLALDILDNIPKNYNVKILDVLPYFCDKDYCYGDKNSVPLYRDTNHVSEYGNKILIPLFRNIE